MKLNDAVYVVVDTETTGLDVAPGGADRLCELAAVAVTADGYVSDPFQTLVDPGIPIPPTASAIHHLTDVDVRDAPTPLCAVADMVDRFEAQVYVAHNAEFDRNVVRINDVPWLCTHRLALHLWPQAPGHGNQVLRYWLDVEPNLPDGLHPHRAAYDALCTAAIFREQLASVRHRWIEIETVEQLAEQIAKPVLLHTVPFSAHRGRPWSEMDRGFLEWVAARDFSIDVLHTANHWLDHVDA